MKEHNFCEHVVRYIKYMYNKGIAIEGASYDAEYEIYCDNCDQFFSWGLDLASISAFCEGDGDDEE